MHDRQPITRADTDARYRFGRMNSADRQARRAYEIARLEECRREFDLAHYSPSFFDLNSPGSLSEQGPIYPPRCTSLVRYDDLVVSTRARPRQITYPKVACIAAIIVGLYYLAQISTSLLEMERMQSWNEDTAGLVLGKSNDHDRSSSVGTRTYGAGLTVRGFKKHPRPTPFLRSSGYESAYGQRANDHRMSEFTESASALTSAPKSSEGHIDNFREYVLDASIKPIAGAVVHKNSLGLPDYWIISYPGETAPVLIIPYGTTKAGIAAHRLDNARNYTISPTGGWMSAN